ncbi:unnamed protein product [Cylindrotheca closterium]|uniref:Uncharacterized protein n=1 Tax=Cylindrotheca closterium TaxID=2856 RepID=A0AAD2PUD6_9STRA|nr:unnamed protein product [Cylindrotheca closterium]
MPQTNIHNQKTKKKGHAPKHQNTFAFKHNPKSKKTDKIMNFPNEHVCRRCHDKIEWRKQYRKYKPRTQPGKCNGCPKRNVKAAYHTICASCTKTSDKAKEIIEEHLATLPEEEREETRPTCRACAMCVKEIALPDENEEDEDDEEIIASLTRMKLRERKALERQLLKEEKANSSKSSSHSDDPSEDGGPLQESSDNPLGRIEEDGHVGNSNADDDEDDPFLKAVGGADKLLTGEAYHRKLLLEQEQKLGTTVTGSTTS